ncbi:MAG TPA: tetratricopeptide repeat protein [Verrucomicrobiae bacterium]|nr:tetratricopeptide repeat protein [Verrucomicrobiae bacterium]
MNERSESNKLLWLGALLVLALTITAHLRGLQGQFVEWDDTNHITRNVAIRALTVENLGLMFAHPIAKLYCPLTWLSFAIDYQIWGRDPFGYHLTNLLLHLANTLLVLVFVREILRDRFKYATAAALLTAVFFGVHPLRVESVAWATERKDVLFAFFYLCALIAYWRWLGTQKARTYWTCFGLFVASTLSKSTAVTFPLVLLVIDYWLARRKAWGEKVPFFAVSLVITAITFMAQAGGTGETVATPAIIPLWARPGLAGYCSLFYVKKFFWPAHLSAVYPSFDEMGWTPFISLGYLAALAAVTAMVVIARRRWPALLPAWLFYLVTLSPTIGLIPVGIHIVADRFSYLPLIGLALPLSMAVVGVMFSLPNTTLRFAMSLTTVVVLVILTFLTDQRGTVWKDTGTLFGNALLENPKCLPAHINLTVWHTTRKEFDEAIDQGKQAVEIAPDGIPGRKNLAYALINKGDRRAAVGVLRPLAQHDVQDPDVWRALAECFEALGDTNNAKLARTSQRRCEGKL